MLTEDAFEFIDSETAVAPPGRVRLRKRGSQLQVSISGAPYENLNGGTGGSGGNSVLIGSNVVAVNGTAEVAGFLYADLTGVDVISFTARCEVAGGTGHIKFYIGGTEDSPTDGDLIASVAVTDTSFIDISQSDLPISYTGVQLIKCVLDPTGVTGTGIISAFNASVG